MTEDEVTVEARRRARTPTSVTRTDLLDPPRPGLRPTCSGSRCPGPPRPRSRWATSTPTNFRYLNHFFEVNQAQSVRELDEIEKEFQGIPWVNTIAADSSGEAYYADIGADPPRHQRRRRPTCNTRGRPAATFAALGLPVLDGTRSSCEWGSDPDAGRAPGIFGYEQPAEALPRRLRHQLERQLLALEPRGAAGGLRPDHRRRAHRARAADPDRAEDAHRALRRPGPAGDRPAQPPGRPEHRLQQPPVRRRALARRAGRLLRGRPRRHAAGQRGPGRRQRRLPGARGLGPARRPRLARGDPLPPLRHAGAAGRRRRWSATRPSTRRRFDAHDPVNTPERPQHRQPAGRAGARRRGLGPRRRRHPPRRAAARLPVREARRREDPDPRRPRRRRRLQRDQRQLGRPAGRAGLPEHPPRLELRDGHPVHRTALRRRRPLDPHLLAVGQPGLALLRPTRPGCSRTRSGSTRPSARTRSAEPGPDLDHDPGLPARGLRAARRSAGRAPTGAARHRSKARRRKRSCKAQRRPRARRRRCKKRQAQAAQAQVSARAPGRAARSVWRGGEPRASRAARGATWLSSAPGSPGWSPARQLAAAGRSAWCSRRATGSAAGP